MIVEKVTKGAVVENCIADVTIASGVDVKNKTSYVLVGGVVGQNVGTVTNCQVITTNTDIGVQDGTTRSTGTLTASAVYESAAALYAAKDANEALITAAYDATVWSFANDTPALIKGCVIAYSEA